MRTTGEARHEYEYVCRVMARCCGAVTRGAGLMVLPVVVEFVWLYYAYGE